ncbi:protein DCL, chloroplastic-like [Chenopodium quinoa]|uniref:DCL protein n=1 Tax=Chenopodium quinoa TaxID=63459 RepID=A0A803N7A8_CHEQI|nr:protein DCL, chloroplastic-like [Chenopodium quinoa]
MAVPPILRGLSLLRLHLRHRLAARIPTPLRRPFFSTTFSGSTPSPLDTSSSTSELSKVQNPPNSSNRINNPSNVEWQDMEKEILRDIEPVVLLLKDILHSDRYMDGERLTPDDENVIRERLLAYHPSIEEKIGCGLDSIMVDQHPQFERSRSLFVVRTDGGWIDFSYQKCLREYVRQKFPSYSEYFEQQKSAVIYKKQPRRLHLWSRGGIM